MPYIKQEMRERLDTKIAELVIAAVETNVLHGENQFAHRDSLVGISNYVVTKVLLGMFGVRRGEMRYADVNAIQGVLKCVGDEFYRRLGGPYEDEAVHKNGDLPEYDFPDLENLFEDEKAGGTDPE